MIQSNEHPTTRLSSLLASQDMPNTAAGNDCDEKTSQPAVLRTQATCGDFSLSSRHIAAALLVAAM